MKRYFIPTLFAGTTAIVYERSRMKIYKEVPAIDLSGKKRPKVVIIGGGIIGAMTAFYLNKEFDITLIDLFKSNSDNGCRYVYSGVIDPYISSVLPWTTQNLPMFFYNCIFHWRRDKFSIDLKDYIKKGRLHNFIIFWYYNLLARQSHEIKQSQEFGHKLCMISYSLISDLLKTIGDESIPRNMDQDQYILLKKGHGERTFKEYKKNETREHLKLVNNPKEYQELLTEGEKKYFSKYDEVITSKVHLSHTKLILENAFKYLSTHRSNFTRIIGEVKHISSCDNKIQGVTFTDSMSEDGKEITIDCDLCILCSGVDTLNIKIVQNGKTNFLTNFPILPCRGYGVEVKPKEGFEHLYLNKCYIDSFWYFTHQGNEDKRVKIVSFGDYDLKPSEFQLKERVDYIMEKIKNVFGDDYEICSPIWTGVRSISPNDTPIINKSWKYQNLYFNVGHGSKGFRYSIGSAIHLNDMIESNHHVQKDAEYYPKEILDKYKPKFELKYFI